MKQNKKFKKLSHHRTGHLTGGFSSLDGKQMNTISGGNIDGNTVCENTSDCTGGTNEDFCTNSGVCLPTKK